MYFYLYDSGDYLGVVRRRRASVGLSDGVRRDFCRRRDRVDCFVRAGDDHVVFCKRQKVCFVVFTFGWTSSRVCLCLWTCPSSWHSSAWIRAKERIRTAPVWKAKRTTRDTGRNRRILVISPEQVEHRERGREQEDSFASFD